jgi:hypothetical protein
MDDLLDSEKLSDEFKPENMVQIHVTRQEAEEIAHNRRDLCIIVGSDTVLEKRILESACGILDVLHAPKKKAPRKRNTAAQKKAEAAAE